MALELDVTTDLAIPRGTVCRLAARFPPMFVNLKIDRDTYRLETMRDPAAAVCPEPPVYCQPFSMEDGCGLLRVTYLKNRLGIEMFHSISDGSGGMILLKTLAAEYYRALGEDIPCEYGVCTSDESASPEETVDSFRACYEPELEGVSRSGRHAYQFAAHGPFRPWHQTEFRIPLDALKSAGKAHNATITVYAAALYLDLLRTAADAEQSKKPVVLSVPINLRPFFDSQTLRNFSLYFLASVPQDKPHPTFDDILANVQTQLKEGTDKDLLRRTIHQNVSQAELPVFVKAPRQIKKCILNIGAKLYGEGLYTSTFSNLGVFRLPDALARHVRDFHAMLGESPVNHIKILSYSYNGLVSLTFSSRLAEKKMEDAIAARLRQEGLPFTTIRRPSPPAEL